MKKNLIRMMKLLSSSCASRNRKSPHRTAGLKLALLESREMPAILTWASGLSSPQSGGIEAIQTATGELVLGGDTAASNYFTVLDPAYQAVIAPAKVNLDYSRSSPGVGLLPSGLVLVYGGLENGYAINSVSQYDPNTQTVADGASNQTRALRSLSVPRAAFGAVTDANSHLSYAIGGIDNNGTVLASSEAYSPSTNSWAAIASLPVALTGESAVSDGAGHIFVFGGAGASGSITNNVYCYTISTNAWAQVASLPVAVRDSSAVLAPNGRVYVMGGSTTSGVTAAVESYSISSNTWATETLLPQPLRSTAAMVDSLGRIEVMGGYDAAGNESSMLFVSQKLSQPDALPAFQSTPGTVVLVNTTYTYQAIAAGNPQPTFALTSAPPGMTINANTGLISWTPSFATEGVYAVSISATNSKGTATQTFNISVVPNTPTGLSGTGISSTSTRLSWDATDDPNVVAYYLYRRTFLHDPKGSGGRYIYTLVNVASTNSAILSGSNASGTFLVAAINNAGVVSSKSTPAGASVQIAPTLFTAITLSGADISSQSLTVGQTGQLYLIQEFGNPAPTYSLVNGPAGISVSPSTGLVTYTPVAADIGTQVVTFAATNVVGTSNYQFVYYINANTPTLSLNNDIVAYDGNFHAASALALGVDGVTSVAGSFTYTYNGSASPPTDAGTYSVVATFVSAVPSYANATTTGTIVIQPAAPTIAISGSGAFSY